MDGLRWLLLLFGVIVVAGVYFYTRYYRQQGSDSPQQDLFSGRREPSLDARVSSRATDSDEPARQMEAGDDDVAETVDQKIVTVRIVARNHGSFAGDELVLSLRGIGLRHGKFGIFHRYEGTAEDSVIFSAASLVEPGSFDLANIKEQQIPGISLFLVLPGPVEGAEAFDLMMAAARALTQSLDAELLDETGSTLSIQRERYLREEIIQYEHSHSIA